MVRRMFGLAVLVALVGPAACLDDEGPSRFTTAGTCLAGDVEGCSCTRPGHEGDPGVRTCGENGRFGEECRCLGCTVYPDCGKCSTCMEKCVCQTSGKEAECKALCEGGDGGIGEGGFLGRDSGSGGEPPR